MYTTKSRKYCNKSHKQRGERELLLPPRPKEAADIPHTTSPYSGFKT